MKYIMDAELLLKRRVAMADGLFAELVIWRVPTTTQIPYYPGADLVRTVIKRGRVVLDRP